MRTSSICTSIQEKNHFDDYAASGTTAEYIPRKCDAAQRLGKEGRLLFRRQVEELRENESHGAATHSGLRIDAAQCNELCHGGKSTFRCIYILHFYSPLTVCLTGGHVVSWGARRESALPELLFERHIFFHVKDGVFKWKAGNIIYNIINTVELTAAAAAAARSLRSIRSGSVAAPRSVAALETALGASMSLQSSSMCQWTKQRDI